jgi:hypothetical protein
MAMVIACAPGRVAQNGQPEFSVIAFFTAKHDQAHISFVHEANRWFPEMAARYHFRYDTTSDWRNLNAGFLSKYQVVVFLDTRPEDPAQRAAFRTYTWRPTSAILRVEDRTHPATGNLPATFKSSPSEWYRWEKDLRQNPDIDILLSIDSTSFPLGTGPKPHEIWHSGYYPVVWTNRKYRMIYLNMGHNDIDYEHKYDATDRTLSYTLNNPIQDRLIMDALLWLGSGAESGRRRPSSPR